VTAPGTGLRALAAVGLLALAAGARADGFGLAIQPSYVLTQQERRDQLGVVTEDESRQLGQAYRLAYDGTLGSALTLTAGAMLDDRRIRSRSGDEWSSSHSTNRGLFSRLNLALPALSGGVGYDLAQALSSGSPTLTSEGVSLFSHWLPLGLPELSLRLARIHQYDKQRRLSDTTTTSAMVSAQYRQASWEAKYALVWGRPDDALTGTVTSSVSQMAQGTFSDRILDGRTSLYASVTLRNLMVRTLSAGTGDIVLQQHPVGGLSQIEAFADTPALDVLSPNPALVDGNTTAGAALDVGYALSQAGDQRYRDVGVQFADLLTSVNLVQVWVDRRLPEVVAAAYEWTVWQSDDNRSWVPVNIARPVAFAPFQNYFEIPIQLTTARYLKVVTRPPPAVTTDPAYATVLITELQVFQVSTAIGAPRLIATSSAAGYLSSTTQLWRPINLAWDFSGSLERRISPTDTLWSVTNGLTASQALTLHLTASQRVARQDGDYGQGRSGKTEWSAGLTWKPLTTFFSSLNYSGQFVDRVPTLDIATGTYYTAVGGMTNTVASLVRADLYEGISTQLNATGSVNNVPGKDTWSATFNATASFVPNPYATLTLGYLSAYTRIIDQELGRDDSSSKRADASLSLRPSSALSMVASISRTITEPKPYTTGTAQLAYAPFRGDLQLSMSYSRSFETASRTSSELFSPSLRWYVRQGIQASTTYTYTRSEAPVSETRTKTLAFALSINL